MGSKKEKVLLDASVFIAAAGRKGKRGVGMSLYINRRITEKLNGNPAAEYNQENKIG
ncbi:MAG: hypothetical protein U5N58_03035 [Actinomycetota bacterium]|nr:hypothetical protein [Actinomycetota bacterium]